MNIPEDLNHHLKTTEAEAEAQARAMKRMDTRDWSRADASNAIFTCPSHFWDALQSAIASRDFMETGKQMENILYEWLTQKEIERE